MGNTGALLEDVGSQPHPEYHFQLFTWAAGTGRGMATTSPRCWEDQGSLPLEQTTPASFSCPQWLTIQPRELQLASEDSVPVHSTSSSMIGPCPVGTKRKPGATLEEEPDLGWGPGLLASTGGDAGGASLRDLSHT